MCLYWPNGPVQKKSGYIGVLATDAAGEHFRTVLQAENVDISRLRRGVGRTACNYITLDDQGDRAFSGNNGQETVQNLYRPIITSADRMYAATFDVVPLLVFTAVWTMRCRR